MHHHAATDYARNVQAERLDAARRRRLQADGADLETLVGAAAAGDSRAWSAIVTRFGPYLTRVARSHGLSAQEAEDAVQETWIRLLRSIRQVRDPRAIGGWLTTTARHESLRTRQRARRETPTDQELLPDACDDEDASQLLDAMADRAAIRSALDSLSGRQRELMLALFDDSEPSYVEIAERLDIPVGSIGPTRGRCLAQLRRDVRLRRIAEIAD
jgi:RNA polymerase sigma factor (sigma-70 family)